MELIQRYIYAIERRLPRAGREDIAKEINSLIMDELEGKFGAKNEYSKNEIEFVLKEMGHPREVAMRYRTGKNYLIGPELYPFYVMVLWIVIGATTLGLTVSFLVGEFAAMSIGWETLWRFFALLGSIIGAVLSAVGAVTIVFMLIDRFAKKSDMKDFDINKDWKPKDLPDMPHEKDKVPLAEPIIAMVFIVIWAVFINTYARTGGIPYVQNLSSDITILPIFNIEAVRQFLPLWNIQIAASLVLQLILLVKGKWQIGTRLFEIGTDLLSIGVLAVMIAGPILIDVSGAGPHALDWIADAARFEQVYYTILKVIMGITILSVVVKTIKLIVRQVQGANE